MRQILKISELFSQLDDKALDEIASAAVSRKSSRGEMLFYEGDPAHSFFIVGSGKVKVFKLSPEGKEQILMIAQPGDSIAEAALFAGGAYPASAQTMKTPNSWPSTARNSSACWDATPTWLSI